MRCKKCDFDNPESHLFCGNCGVPITPEGQKKALGWRPVIKDLCLPGWGHYALGYKRMGIFIILLFTVLLTLHLLNSADMAIKAMNETMHKGGVPSQAALLKALEAQKNWASDFLSWAYLILWVATVANSIRVRLS